MARALITGTTGQDGSYLSEYLLEKGYEVIGIVRRSSTNTHERIKHLEADNRFTLVEGDITDPSSILTIVDQYQPCEIYNLAAQSHVGTSFKQPAFTFEVNANGVLNILEAVRLVRPNAKVYQAGTSEMFGDNYCVEQDDYEYFRDGSVVFEGKKYQDECTQLKPRSPYAVAKVAAHNLIHTYREAYGIFACNGILFNHESPRRGENFVTRKITKWIAHYVQWAKEQPICELGQLRFEDDPDMLYGTLCDKEGFPKLRLGNIDAYRDWGFAGDYVRAMHMMLQADKPDDYVIATGETYQVRDFLKEAFAVIGIENWEDFIVIDPEFYRPAEVEYLRGSPAKANRKLGWEPQVTFKELTKMMVESDVQRAGGYEGKESVGHS